VRSKRPPQCRRHVPCRGFRVHRGLIRPSPYPVHAVLLLLQDIPWKALKDRVRMGSLCTRATHPDALFC
jgi:hypothetical protein